MLYSYTSAAPDEPPDPAVIVAPGPVYPAQTAVPLIGVARFKVGFTTAAEIGQDTMTVGPVGLQPKEPAERLPLTLTLPVADVVLIDTPEV
jgi:hypothetical protein